MDRRTCTTQSFESFARSLGITLNEELISDMSVTLEIEQHTFFLTKITEEAKGLLLC